MPTREPSDKASIDEGGGTTDPGSSAPPRAPAAEPATVVSDRPEKLARRGPGSELKLSGQTFAIKEQLGCGGMAEVSLAVRQGPANFERKVVVKRILPERSADPVYVQRFIREASLAARLHHPNIVEVLELGNVDGDYYIVMEYVDGPNLHDIGQRLEKRQQRMPVNVATRVAADVAGALHFAHTFVSDDGVKHRVVHRDVSTTNIMISSAGQVKLVDFGVAKDLDSESLTVGLGFVGKPLYMTPEAIEGDDPHPSWDIYALGMVLYIALAGQPPADWVSGSGGMAALVHVIATKMPTPIRRLNREVPRALEELIMCCLAKQPRDRPESAAVLQAGLEKVLASSPPVTATSLAAFVADLRLRPKDGAETSAGAADSTVLDVPLHAPLGADLVAVTERPAAAPLWPKALAGLGVLATLVALVIGASRCDQPSVRNLLHLEQASAPSEDEAAAPATSGDAEEASVTLKVECASWGWVTVDGRRVGLCPVPSTRITPGKHVVGFEDRTGKKTRELDAEPKSSVTVTFGPGKR